ncbi:MAG TPA: GNAT family N-acetyltransferase [Acidimicrobiales bacterium]
MTLTIVAAHGDLLEQWRAVHNRVIAPTQLSTEEVAERAVRNSLTVGYMDGDLVGNATVRAPEDGVVTVIVRVLPEHRRQGHGSEYLGVLLRETHDGMVKQIKTMCSPPTSTDSYSPCDTASKRRCVTRLTALPSSN